MHNSYFAIFGFIIPVFLAVTISNAVAAPPANDAEERYVAARDAAIEKLSAIDDAGNSDDAARKVEEAATADLAAQMRAILNESTSEGFGPARPHIDTFYRNDEGFGMLDGLRFGPCSGRTARRPARTAPTANMSSRRHTSSSRRRRCSNGGFAPTRTGGATTSRTFRNRSARR